MCGSVAHPLPACVNRLTFADQTQESALLEQQGNPHLLFSLKERSCGFNKFGAREAKVENKENKENISPLYFVLCVITARQQKMLLLGHWSLLSCTGLCRNAIKSNEWP